MSRSGIQGFESERLIQALAARRLSQLQVAELVGISATTVSKWRNGIQAPEHETLERLAKVLNVAPEWFTRPTFNSLSGPLFRSNASAHTQARAKLAARLHWAHDVTVALEEFVDLPLVNIPLRTFLEPEEITQGEIEAAANETRELWSLGRGPIQDLALAAEGAGIVLVREETGIAQIEGLSAWSESLNRPFVLLSADKDNAYRSRFDLAHEIAHLVLHRRIASPNERERHKLMERQAHAFAGALLMPAESFSSDVRANPTLDDLLLLKRRWGASVAAIIMRIASLDLIDEFEKLALFKRRSARWGSKAEPGDADRQVERARLLSRTIQLLVEQHVMPLAAVPLHFGLSAHDTASLTGLPLSYFNGPGEVVDLATLRAARSIEEKTINKASGSVLPFKRR